LEVDPTGGPLFGSSDAKLNDFLRPGEIVLTFDDGPWKDRTPKVLAALARHCTKAIFFAIGKHTIWYPEVLQQVAAAGHTIGWHTWSHKNMAKLTFEEGKTEIELGLAAVRDVIGDAVVPFFRFPQLRRPEEIEAYLKQRNVAIWAADIDSMDYRLRNSKKVIKTVMKQLEERGKGIILMHDFQEATADGIDTLLDELQTHGYKVVEVRAKGTIKSLPDYDAMLQANTDFQCSRAGREGKPASALTCD
jgi:peptidoglycan/xylan/chitin deacetylase (PgdA/CDA1 family)